MGTHPDRSAEHKTPSAPPVANPQTPARPTPADEAGAFTRAGALWVALTLGFLILIVLLIFIVQNQDPVDFEFITWKWRLPLGVATLFAAIAGGLVTIAVGMVRMIQLRRAAKHNLAKR